MRLAASAVLLSFLSTSFSPLIAQAPAKQPRLGHRSVRMLTVDGLQFKDLNHNGKLDVYEDWRKSPAERAKNLVSLMGLEDLAGVMVHGTLPATGGAEAAIGRGSGYDLEKSRGLIEGKRVNSFITRLGGDPTMIADSSNKLQEIAESTRFGIPLTISTDPRNNFLYVPGASVEAGSFSKWPETTGFAAINDSVLTRKFADTVRREYMAVGIREALSPQADLSTEPRWARINGTFGEDADVAKAQVEAYVEGMQDGKTGLKPTSVVTVVKHWVGYGAQKDGLDSHNYYGRMSALTTDQLPLHIKPFLGAFDAHVAAVMPAYSIFDNVTVNGKPVEKTGAGYSKLLLTDLLRGKYGFQGVILSDWGITADCSDLCRDGMPAGQKATPAQISTGWGVQDLTQPQRFAKTVNAGVDQVGGTENVEAILTAQKDGLLTEARMRQAAERVLEQKFEIGLFEDPYVDAAAAKTVVGDPAAIRAGEDAQKRAMVPLENKRHAVPLKAGAKVWLFNVSADVAKAHGFTVVSTPAEADVAVIRAAAPSDMLHPNFFFGSRQHEGRLNFKAGDASYDALLKAGKTPVVMTVYMDRPAILTDVKDKVSALYADFGVSDGALLDVLSGKAKAEGHLPFELPSSMDAVLKQNSGLPHDSVKPLYPYGYALK